MWAGVECSLLRVGRLRADQLTATGHAARPADLELLPELGVSAVRYPVLWGWRSRGAQATDWKWADARIGRLLELGLRPVIGLLHHGSGPGSSSFLDPDFPQRFGAFADTVARRYPGVREFLPINEPLTTARFSGLYGTWHPHARDHAIFTRMLLSMAGAAREAARAIRAATAGAVIIQNEDLGHTQGTPAVRDAVTFDNHRRWLTFDLMTGRVGPSHPLWNYLAGDRERAVALESLRDDPEPPDVLGLDYYVTSDRYLDHRLERYPAWTHGGDGKLAYADVERVRCAFPPASGFSRALDEAWRRYQLPLSLAEVNLSGEPDDQVAWWWEAWDAALRARASGIDVRSVTCWSVFGARGWASLLRRPDGRHEAGAVDVRRGAPRLTALGRAVQAAAQGSGSAPQSIGWWRRPERVLYSAPTARCV